MTPKTQTLMDRLFIVLLWIIGAVVMSKAKDLIDYSTAAAFFLVAMLFTFLLKRWKE